MKAEITNQATTGYLPYLVFTAENIREGFSLGTLSAALQQKDIEFQCLENRNHEMYVGVDMGKVLDLLGGSSVGCRFTETLSENEST